MIVPTTAETPNSAAPAAWREVVIVNPQGLHFRPASAFAQMASQYPGNTVIVRDNGKQANGKSLTELLMLVALEGHRLILEVTGPNAEAVVEPLADILAADEFTDEEPKGQV